MMLVKGKILLLLQTHVPICNGRLFLLTHDSLFTCYAYKVILVLLIACRKQTKPLETATPWTLLYSVCPCVWGPRAFMCHAEQSEKLRRRLGGSFGERLTFTAHWGGEEASNLASLLFLHALLSWSCAMRSGMRSLQKLLISRDIRTPVQSST